MQHEDYVLWRLRDQPGQSTLSEFRPQPLGRTAAFAADVHQPAAVFRNRSAAIESEAVAALNDRLVQQSAADRSASAVPEHSKEGHADDESAAAVGKGDTSDAHRVGSLRWHSSMEERKGGSDVSWKGLQDTNVADKTQKPSETAGQQRKGQHLMVS